jgi:hypothetical protein
MAVRPVWSMEAWRPSDTPWTMSARSGRRSGGPIRVRPSPPPVVRAWAVVSFSQRRASCRQTSKACPVRDGSIAAKLSGAACAPLPPTAGTLLRRPARPKPGWRQRRQSGHWRKLHARQGWSWTNQALLAPTAPADVVADFEWKCRGVLPHGCDDRHYTGIFFSSRRLATGHNKAAPLNRQTLWLTFG